MKKPLTQTEIQDINRRIAAGTYVHEPETDKAVEEKPETKPKPVSEPKSAAKVTTKKTEDLLDD